MFYATVLTSYRVISKVVISGGFRVLCCTVSRTCTL
nr:MAG TPA: hypothetical protein [Caudoviricetes sp.]